MVSLWFLGDSSRLLYYVYKNQPIQFYFGTGIAAALDLIVLCQIVFMKGRRLESI